MASVGWPPPPPAGGAEAGAPPAPGRLPAATARRRCRGWRAASAGSLEGGLVLALLEQERDRLVDLDPLGPTLDENLAQRALVDRLHLHGGLVGLDLGDHVARLDRVALVLQPPREVALGHGGR